MTYCQKASPVTLRRVQVVSRLARTHIEDDSPFEFIVAPLNEKGGRFHRPGKPQSLASEHRDAGHELPKKLRKGWAKRLERGAQARGARRAERLKHPKQGARERAETAEQLHEATEAPPPRPQDVAAANRVAKQARLAQKEAQEWLADTPRNHPQWLTVRKLVHDAAQHQVKVVRRPDGQTPGERKRAMLMAAVRLTKLAGPLSWLDAKAAEKAPKQKQVLDELLGSGREDPVTIKRLLKRGNLGKVAQLLRQSKISAEAIEELRLTRYPDLAAIINKQRRAHAGANAQLNGTHGEATNEDDLSDRPKKRPGKERKKEEAKIVLAEVLDQFQSRHSTMDKVFKLFDETLVAYGNAERWSYFSQLPPIEVRHVVHDMFKARVPGAIRLYAVYDAFRAADGLSREFPKEAKKWEGDPPRRVHWDKSPQFVCGTFDVAEAASAQALVRERQVPPALPGSEELRERVEKARDQLGEVLGRPGTRVRVDLRKATDSLRVAPVVSDGKEEEGMETAPEAPPVAPAPVQAQESPAPSVSRSGSLERSSASQSPVVSSNASTNERIDRIVAAQAPGEVKRIWGDGDQREALKAMGPDPVVLPTLHRDLGKVEVVVTRGEDVPQPVSVRPQRTLLNMASSWLDSWDAWKEPKPVEKPIHPAVGRVLRWTSTKADFMVLADTTPLGHLIKMGATLVGLALAMMVCYLSVRSYARYDVTVVVMQTVVLAAVGSFMRRRGVVRHKVTVVRAYKLETEADQRALPDRSIKNPDQAIMADIEWRQMSWPYIAGWVEKPKTMRVCLTEVQNAYRPVAIDAAMVESMVLVARRNGENIVAADLDPHSLSASFFMEALLMDYYERNRSIVEGSPFIRRQGRGPVTCR